MREQKRKSRAPARQYSNEVIWRDELVADVFALWLGISRLMDNVRGPQFSTGQTLRGVRRPQAKKAHTARRVPRRHAA